MKRGKSGFAACAVFLLVTCVAGQDTTSHSDHDHDTHDSHSESTHDSHDEEEGDHFEAAAVYDVGVGTNSFIAFPPEGSFEEETFAFMIVPTATADEAGLEEAEEDAETGA